MRCVEFYISGFGATCIAVCKDKEGANHQARNPVCTSNSKNIDVRNHFLRELIFTRQLVIH